MAAILRFIAPTLMALSIAAVAYIAFVALLKLLKSNRAASSLADYYKSVTSTETGAEKPVPTGSFEHKMRLAALQYKMDVRRNEQAVFWGAVVVVSLALFLGLLYLGVPAALYLLAPMVGWVFVNGQVNGAWQKMRMALEKELPTFLLRMSATVQATPNVPEALADVTESLDPNAPLQAWMKRLQIEVQLSGRKGLENIQDEAASISPSLAMAVLQIARLWETGGVGYISSFQMASQSMANILEGRAQAAAKADGAWGTIRVILLALGGSLMLAMSSSGGGGLFSTSAVQIAMLAAVAWAIVGWNVLGDTIREVME